MFICFLIAYVRCLIQSQIAVIIFCRHGASEGLLIFGEGGGYESVKQNVSDDGEFSELYLFHADIEVALHNSLFYFSFIRGFSFTRAAKKMYFAFNYYYSKLNKTKSSLNFIWT
jgi:hypothetical protein